MGGAGTASALAAVVRAGRIAVAVALPPILSVPRNSYQWATLHEVNRCATSTAHVEKARDIF